MRGIGSGNNRGFEQSVGMEKLPVNAQLLRVMDRPVDKIATHP
jgi:hypothetical protein